MVVEAAQLLINRPQGLQARTSCGALSRRPRPPLLLKLGRPAKTVVHIDLNERAHSLNNCFSNETPCHHFRDAFLAIQAKMMTEKVRGRRYFLPESSKILQLLYYIKPTIAISPMMYREMPCAKNWPKLPLGLLDKCTMKKSRLAYCMSKLIQKLLHPLTRHSSRLNTRI